MIRIDNAQLRVKRIRQSRNGAFCVADLSTDIGEFKVKDPLLDQFEEGEYQTSVWISEIYLSQYVAFGKGVTEIRARLHDLQVNAQDALRPQGEQAEPDPLDEQTPVRAMPATTNVDTGKSRADEFSRFHKPRKAKGKSEDGAATGASTTAADDLHALFDAQQIQVIHDRNPVKLDATVDRALLRRQAAELGQKLGYRFDAKQQTWFPE